MTELSIFEAQTENVRELEKAWKDLNRTINSLYANNNHSSAKTHTKLLTQLYCAYAESIFVKLLHTPNGFTEDEILQINKIKKRNIVAAWKKVTKLSLSKLNNPNNNHIPNTIRKVFDLINEYISDPSLIRNKLAHGQWVHALNRKNSKVHPEFENEDQSKPTVTHKIRTINSVDLHKKKEAFDSLYRIIEDIIESPHKAHYRDYWIHINKMESLQDKMKGWNIEDKIKKLVLKRKQRKIN